jgi:hypothetical protein
VDCDGLRYLDRLHLLLQLPTQLRTTPVAAGLAFRLRVRQGVDLCLSPAELSATMTTDDVSNDQISRVLSTTR